MALLKVWGMGFIAFESGVFTLPLDYYSEQLEQLNGLKWLEQSKHVDDCY